MVIYSFGLCYELWVPNAEQPYVVSHSVKSQGETVSLQLSQDGYLKVNVWIGPKRKYKYLHSLVAELILGPRPDGYEINHKDGNKLNNHPSNLEYVTHKENMQHAARTGLLPDQSKENNSNWKGGFDVVAYRQLNRDTMNAYQRAYRRNKQGRGTA